MASLDFYGDVCLNFAATFMNEERLSEIEDWAQVERGDLTESENVLLDAITEICIAVRHAWQTQEAQGAALETWREKATEFQDQLRRDREAMEGADLELAVGDSDASEQARTILRSRLNEHPDFEEED